MKGIYLTEEGKKEIEAKISELSGYKDQPETTQLAVYKEILSSAIIIPVEENWDFMPYEQKYRTFFAERHYPNGVIIQPNKIK